MKPTNILIQRRHIYRNAQYVVIEQMAPNQTFPPFTLILIAWIRDMRHISFNFMNNNLLKIKYCEC